jgi:hypothetical protein
MRVSSVKELGENLANTIHRQKLPGKVIHRIPTYRQLIQTLLDFFSVKV